MSRTRKTSSLKALGLVESLFTGENTQKERHREMGLQANELLSGKPLIGAEWIQKDLGSRQRAGVWGGIHVPLGAAASGEGLVTAQRRVGPLEVGTPGDPPLSSSVHSFSPSSTIPPPWSLFPWDANMPQALLS